MTVVASLLLVISVWLAVLLGPKLHCWMWGPALLALGLAMVAALPGWWRSRSRPAGWGWAGGGVVVAGWFAWRAWTSPVAECGMADLMLLAAAVGGFVATRALQEQALAERVFLWGLALLVLASGVMVAWQVVDPASAPALIARGSKFPAGFFGHYNYGANFLIGSSCLVGGAALCGRFSNLERALWGVIAVGGMVAVYFTRSRGGIVGAASALGIFAALALIIGKRHGSRWFAPGIVALPLIGLGLAVFLFKGWSDSQVVRNQAAGLDTMLDNTIRLHLIGIATSCISLHPWQGGGSRSFSWECYRFWELHTQGPGSHRPEQVHNEILQAATDYGVIGAGLLLLFIGTLGVGAVIRTLFADASDQVSSENSWRLGGLAGLVGILVQSNFCFVFHVVPGAMLLGLCLGRVAHTGGAGKTTPAKPLAAAIGGATIALACAALLVPMGWLGSRVTAARWADRYGKPAAIAPEARLAALTEAIRIWPLKEFYQDRAAIYQRALAPAADGAVDPTALRMAIDDFQAAANCQRFDPEPVVNRANLLSLAQRDGEAEAAFASAIRLQGGMEPAFRSEFFLARHYLQKAMRQLAANELMPAMATLQLAVAAIEKAVAETPPWTLGTDGQALRVSIHESLGVARELSGDLDGALAAYNAASSLPAGSRAHYRAAVLIGKRAKQTWFERKPAAALSGFLAAKERFSSASELPAGYTPAQRAEYWEYLNAAIRFLQGARVKPLEESGE